VHLHLLVPALLPTLRQHGADLLRGLDLPALSLLAARGSFSPEPATHAEAWLTGRFGVPGLSSAPYCLSAEGRQLGGDYWLHADPVHLGLQRHGLTIADAALFTLSQQEADTLTADLNAYFAADGLEFFAPAPERWYARSALPLPTARPLAEARGGPAEPNPFPGDDGRWQRLLSEIQMLLHRHAVNDQREARGEPAINSLWLWGGGTRLENARTPYATVFADLLLAGGLQFAAGGRSAPLPSSADSLPNEAGTSLVVLDTLRLPAAYGDLASWRDALVAMEHHWFAPLRQGLKQGKIAALTLFLPADGGKALKIRRRDLWKAWRRPRLTNLFE
jgi:hypothetical protein